MLDKMHCVGCRNNYYNVERDGCWLRKDKEKDEVVKRYSIHMDSPMNIIEHYTECYVPTCYNPGGYSGPTCTTVVNKIQKGAVSKYDIISEEPQHKDWG